MSQQREVPQFVNIEDKIAFQLTAKQLGWIGLGCFFSFMAWVLLDKTFFIITTVIISIVVLALIFLRPYGQSLPSFLKNLFFYTFKPKVFIWKRGQQDSSTEIRNKQPKNVFRKITKKKVDLKDIEKAIQSLDIYE